MASTGSTAFVLGGGGILGAAEVGMLRALLEHDIMPDLVVGSSVGALNGAFIAAEPSLASVDRMVEVWTGLSDRGVFGGSVFGQLSTLARHGTHLHGNDGLRQLIEGELGPLEFADLAVRFECVAASIERATATCSHCEARALINGERVWAASGRSSATVNPATEQVIAMVAEADATE